MKTLYLVNRADAQSIPLEVGHRMAQMSDIQIASFYAGGLFPSGFDLESVRQFGAKHPLDVSAVRGLIRLIRQERPDLIHVHHTASALWCIALARLLGVPAVIKSEHNDHKFQPFYRTLVNMVIYPLCDRILCNSEHTKHSFLRLERWLAGRRVATAYNGVDVSRIDRRLGDGAAMRDELGIGQSAFLLGSIGRLVEQKNLTRLLEALALVTAPDRHRIRLLVVGDGPLRPNLEAKTRDLGLQGRVTFVGAVERDRVYSILGALDGFVVPSLWEGFCNAAVEALAGGVPVLAADIETLREVLDDCAFFADPRSSDAIARGIEALVGMSPEERMALTGRGKALVQSRYTIDATAAAYLDHYRSVLGGPARGQSQAPAR